ncbi:6171_t:CDS:2 [Gigaspora margarita]|uniref:6171_t:CDS:1 n=1 Tax=Gigaspora margarita TaxID=4874 RepID=A0ABN7VSK7_GIGMA|nr:6171_t:CDS:2 [Gigaspora margarita]
MLKHARKILSTVKRSARQYSTSSKDDSVASSIKAPDIIPIAFIGTGAISMYGIWSMVNTLIESSVMPINKKLDKLDTSIEKLKTSVEKLDANIKRHLRAQ